MSPILLHIYGPFAIHSFGLMIVLGLILTLYLLNQDKKLQKIVTPEQLSTIINVSLIFGILGGRIWFLMTNYAEIDHWIDYFTVWNGGLSILGAIIGILIGLPIYLKSQHIPIVSLLDRLVIYAPLLQSISRFGCFFAGCCYGAPTTFPWGIIYTNPESMAPLHIVMHPTQIYSSIFLFLIFIFLYYFDQCPRKKSGQMLSLYVLLAAAERFFLEFWRGDRVLPTQFGYFDFLSTQQILALSLCASAMIMLIFTSIYKKTDEPI